MTVTIKGFYETVSHIVSTKGPTRMKALEAVKSRSIEWPEHVDDYTRLLSALVDSANQGAAKAVVTSANGGSPILISSLGCLHLVITDLQNSTDSSINTIEKRREFAKQILPISQKIIQGLILLLTDNLAVESVLSEPGAIEYISKIIRLMVSRENFGLLTIHSSLFTSSVATFLIISLMNLPTGSKRRDDLTRSAAISVMENFVGTFAKSDILNLLELITKLFSQSSKIPEMIFNIFLLTRIIVKSPIIFREIFSEKIIFIEKIFSTIIDFLIPFHQLEKPTIGLIRLLLVFARNDSSDYWIEISKVGINKILETYSDSKDLEIAEIFSQFLILKMNNSESNVFDYLLSNEFEDNDVKPIHHYMISFLIESSHIDHRWQTNPFFVEKFLNFAIKTSPLIVHAIVRKAVLSFHQDRLTDGMKSMWKINIPKILLSLTADDDNKISSTLIDCVVVLNEFWHHVSESSLEISFSWIDKVFSLLNSPDIGSINPTSFIYLYRISTIQLSDSQIMNLFISASSVDVLIFLLNQVIIEESRDERDGILKYFSSRLLAPKTHSSGEESIDVVVSTIRLALSFRPLTTPRPLQTSLSNISGSRIRSVVKSALKFTASLSDKFVQKYAKPSQNTIDGFATLTLSYLILGNLFSLIRCDPCLVTTLLSICSQGVVSRQVADLKNFISKELPIVGDIITLCVCGKHVDKLGEPRSLLSQQAVAIIDSVDMFEESGKSEPKRRKISENLDSSICRTRCGWIASLKANLQIIATRKWNPFELVSIAFGVVEMRHENDSTTSVLELIAFRDELESNHVALCQFGIILGNYFLENDKHISDLLLQEFIGLKIVGDSETTGGYLSLTFSPIFVPLLLSNYNGVAEDIISTSLPPTIGSIALLLTLSLQTESVETFVKTIRTAVAIAPESLENIISRVRFHFFKSVYSLRIFFGKLFLQYTEDDELLQYIADQIGYGLGDILECICFLTNRSSFSVANNSLGSMTGKILTDFSPHKPQIPPSISLLDVAILGRDVIELFGGCDNGICRLRDPFQALQPLGLKLSDRPILSKYLDFRKNLNIKTNGEVGENELNEPTTKRCRTIGTSSPNPLDLILTFVPPATRSSPLSFSEISETLFLASMIASIDEIISDSTVPALYAFSNSNISTHLLGEILSHFSSETNRSLISDSLKPLGNFFPQISFFPSTDQVAYPCDPLCEFVHELASSVLCGDGGSLLAPSVSAWIYSRIENATLLLPFLLLRNRNPAIINFHLNRKISSITIAVSDSLCSIARRIEYVFSGQSVPSSQSVLSDVISGIDLFLLGSNLLGIQRPIDGYFVAELLARTNGSIFEPSQDSLSLLLGTPPPFLKLLLESLNMMDGTGKISSLSFSLHPSLRPILSRLRGDALSVLYEENEMDKLWALEKLGLTKIDQKPISSKIESISTWNNSQIFSSETFNSQIICSNDNNANDVVADTKNLLVSFRQSNHSLSNQKLFEIENILTQPFPPSSTDDVDECWVQYVACLRRGGFLHRARKVAEHVLATRFSETTLPSISLRMYINLSKIFWNLQMMPEATKLIVAVCTSPDSPATRLDDPRVVRIVPRLLSQAGEWVGEQRLEPLSEIRRKFFSKAIQVLNESDLKSIVKVKIRLVKVIDPEIVESKSSPPKSIVSEQVGLLCEILSCGILPVMKAAWFSSRLLSLWFAFPSVASLALSKHRSLLAASEYMLPFFYQIAGQIGSLTGDENIPSEFKKELVSFIIESGRNHPFICLPPLLQLKSSSAASSTHPAGSPASKSCSVKNAKLDSERAKNAEKILEKIKLSTKVEVECMEAGFKFYLNLAMAKPGGTTIVGTGSSTRTSTPIGPKRVVHDIVGYSEYAKAIASGNCPILTCQKELKVKSIVPEYMIADSGKSLPKILKLIDVNGKVHRQIVKGNDDLRNDAVLQQLFSLIDAVCSSGRLRSYKVVPISACAGIAEWVDGTVTLGGYLVGYPNESSGAHSRYRPHDMSPTDVKSAMVSVRQQTKGSVDHIRGKYSELVKKFKPCMHYFFYENFSTTSEWYKAQSAFTSSVAATSIVGFIVGLGDRHPNNILIDIATGEVVHIDYGICFDAGKQLKIPEIVPFRLTRDMVDGLGCLGTQGPFSKICQDVLVSLKLHASMVTAVVEVFVVDPLFNWAVAALKSDNAQEALESVRRKLQGFLEVSDALPLSPSAQVDRLIRSATDSRNLALMFAGWQPWL